LQSTAKNNGNIEGKEVLARPLATLMKKVLGQTQTLRACRSKAEPNFLALPQTPIPGAQDGQNLISWIWSLPSPTDPVW